MRSKMVTSFVLITALSIFLAPAKAEVPGQVNYQGYLTDTDGYPIDGIVDMEFAIYSQEFEGSPIWFEPHYGVTVTAGVYNVTLGETYSITYGLFMSSCWLEVAVGEEGAADLEVLEPRQPIVSSFFAIEANSVPWSGITGIPAGFADGTDDGASDWSQLSGIPAGFADGTDDGASDWSQLSGIPAGFADDTDDGASDWSELSGIPAGFADGVDNEGATEAQLTDHAADPSAHHVPYTDEMAIAAGEPVFVNVTGDTMTGDLSILGNVGIGTTSPSEKLHLAGGNSVGFKITRNDVDNVLIGDNGEADDGSILLYDFEGNLKTVIRADSDSFIQGGNVGIGKSNPKATLHVQTATAGGAYISDEANDLIIENSDHAGLSVLTPNTSKGHISFSDTESAWSGRITYDHSNDSMQILTNSHTAIYMDVDSKVGIGTTGPDVRLHVVDSGSTTEITPVFRLENSTTPTANGAGISENYVLKDSAGERVQAGQIASVWSNYLTDSRVADMAFYTRPDGGFITEKVRITGNGNVGIGSIVPKAKLEIRQSQGNSALRIEAGSPQHTYFLDLIPFSPVSGQIDYEFRVFDNETPEGQTALTIKGQNRNVGIGTTNPQALLHVAGDARIDGNIAAKYQDVAEWVESPQKLEPGTVVVIDKKCSNRVVPSNDAYDPGVAGVVSKEPGLLLGEAGNGKYKISHSGRVRTKVDASFGKIEPGDLLVASPIQGVAMKSEPVNIAGVEIHRPGTILGKALESFDEGEGKSLVLLSLQ